MSTDHSDAAWQELQNAASNLPTDQETEQLTQQGAALAVSAGKKAKDFYTRFPGSTNTLEAKKLECRMLEAAFFTEYDKNVFAEWAAAQQTLLNDPKLTDAGRYEVRLAIHTRKRFDRWSNPDTRKTEQVEDLRELIKDFPDADRPREMMLNCAANLEDAKAREIATEILSLPASEYIRNKAEGILRRLDGVGKPLKIKFTALDGRQVDLNRMKGKVVLVVFWATWCGPCLAEIPTIKEGYKQFHAKGFEVVGISLDSSANSGRQKLERFIQKGEMPWPQHFDGKVWKNEFAIQYGISAIPVLWLVDKQGNLRETLARDDLATKVKRLLEEQEVQR